MATALLERQKVDAQENRRPDAATSEEYPAEYHWTVDAFRKASDAGAFGHEARLELIQGRIFEIMGQGSEHSTLASVIADMLREAAGKRFAIREEKPVQVASDSQPIPDVMVLKGRQTDYKDHQPRPEEVVLIVEISVTTADYDLGKKAAHYARAKIQEYWVVLESEAAIVRHRQPSPEGYGEVTRLAGDDTLSPLALPEAVWTVDELLGRTEAQ